jgi:ABC-type glycerol-3-phosphate transport system substrate-binding protein
MIISEKGYTQKARSGFWQNLYVGAKKFYWSFVKDYSAIGAPIIEDEDIDKYPTISVYVATGREHVEILRRMISDEFTRDHRIKVDVNMVAGGVEGQIMLRYVAGNAPDVAISVGAGTPFEYAIRGALLPLNQFEGFEELKKSYIDDAFNPYLYKGNYYAFPETQSWVALFYRTDIIVDELQLDPPDTWEDVYEMLPVLQEKGYDFYYPYAPGNYIPFLFQHGGNVYDEHAMTSSLDTVEAYNAFKEYADLYIKYKIPYAANFYQRFRNGTIPIGIDGHGFFSQLMVAAPELKGKWDMAPIPGHKLSDGSVVRYAGGLGTCSIIISSTEYPEEAWKFIQWWSSDEVQTQYGQEVEATFGVASRWNPANVEALKTLPYTEKEMSVILEQWSHFKEAHNTLGGYYTHRYLNTALNQTILQGKNARIALEDAVKEINKEMLRKQKEFGITDSVLYPSDSSN